MILRKLLSTTLFSVPFTLAHAGAWNFQYQGFYDQQVHEFDEFHVLEGWFAGDDLDTNGVISVSELTQFYANGTNYLDCGGPLTCVIPIFNFSATGGLDFSTVRIYREGTLTAGHGIVTGDRISEYVTEDGNTNYMAEWLWTDATTLLISPVPEPANWWMLTAGMLLLAGQRRRAKRL